MRHDLWCVFVFLLLLFLFVAPSKLSPRLSKFIGKKISQTNRKSGINESSETTSKYRRAVTRQYGTSSETPPNQFKLKEWYKGFSKCQRSVVSFQQWTKEVMKNKTDGQLLKIQKLKDALLGQNVSLDKPNQKGNKVLVAAERKIKDNQLNNDNKKTSVETNSDDVLKNENIKLIQGAHPINESPDNLDEEDGIEFDINNTNDKFIKKSRIVRTVNRSVLSKRDQRFKENQLIKRNNKNVRRNERIMNLVSKFLKGDDIKKSVHTRKSGDLTKKGSFSASREKMLGKKIFEKHEKLWKKDETINKKKKALTEEDNISINGKPLNDTNDNDVSINIVLPNTQQQQQQSSTNNSPKQHEKHPIKLKQVENPLQLMPAPLPSAPSLGALSMPVSCPECNVNSIVSELTRALDRQQMSNEMQQVSNTIAQTMLNTLILTGHHGNLHGQNGGSGCCGCCGNDCCCNGRQGCGSNCATNCDCCSKESQNNEDLKKLFKETLEEIKKEKEKGKDDQSILKDILKELKDKPTPSPEVLLISTPEPY